MQRVFRIRPVWDADAQVYFAQSDIEGLHVEATTVEEFETIVVEEALDLILSNHVSAAELRNRPVRDLVPAIILERPEPLKLSA